MNINERPCDQCIWRAKDECSSWDCEPVTRKEAKAMIKELAKLKAKVKE